MKTINRNIPNSMKEIVGKVVESYPENKKLQQMFENAFYNTYQTTLMIEEDETFVITGDIPAMWLRDSAAQVRPMLLLVKEDEEIRNIVRGVINLHKKQVVLDPYANAFNKEPNIVGDHCDDITDQGEMIWERKYEIDSLCYPIQLAYLYYLNSQDDSIFDEAFDTMVDTIINTFVVEQDHLEKSPYSFRRIADWLLFDYPERIEFETLNHKGMGNPVTHTGMTWSGFRPSDDACRYGYLVPSNCFAVVVMKYLEEIYTNVRPDAVRCQKAHGLRLEIEQGIKEYAVIKNAMDKDILAYEVDGQGNNLIMDDANVPSLLSLPYLGYTEMDDELYTETRKTILSKENPYYYEGSAAKGIGSPHTPENYIWHISLAIEGLTTKDEAERARILETFMTTDADCNLMHEGFDVDNPNNFTRPWFSWANAMFCEFILSTVGIEVKK